MTGRAEIDPDILAEQLARVLAEPVAPLTVTRLPHGYSNLTYRLELASGRALVLRRPPPGRHAASAHDVLREHGVLRRLVGAYDLAPRPLLAVDDPTVPGAPFFVMEHVDGLVLRRDPPPGLEFGPDTARRLAEAFADALADLHAVDLDHTGLVELHRGGGYVARQVEGWARRWVRAATDDLPPMDRVARWLRDRQPADGRPALVHNDFKYDNLLLDPGNPGRILAVLDWEMATVGDPLLDLGTTLAYWVEADDPPPVQAIRFAPTSAPGSLLRREVATRWAQRSGRDLTHLPFAHAFGLFKVAVIAQQIYARYRAGATSDPRFAGLGTAVRTLAEQAERVTETEAP